MLQRLIVGIFHQSVSLGDLPVPPYGLVYAIPRLGHKRMLSLHGTAVVVEPRVGHVGEGVPVGTLWGRTDD